MKGDQPEDDPFKGYNKFLGRKQEGHRGLLIATTVQRKRAIILSMTTSFDTKDGVKWGNLYEVKEVSEGEYPRLVKKVSVVPDTPDWLIHSDTPSAMRRPGVSVRAYRKGY